MKPIRYFGQLSIGESFWYNRMYITKKSSRTAYSNNFPFPIIWLEKDWCIYHSCEDSCNRNWTVERYEVTK